MGALARGLNVVEPHLHFYGFNNLVPSVIHPLHLSELRMKFVLATEGH